MYVEFILRKGGYVCEHVHACACVHMCEPERMIICVCVYAWLRQSVHGLQHSVVGAATLKPASTDARSSKCERVTLLLHKYHFKLAFLPELILPIVRHLSKTQNVVCAYADGHESRGL